MEESDKNINHPDHYTVGGIEVYDFIESWKLDFAIGNVVKYLARSPYKGKKLEDLKKARWYLNKAIEREEKNSLKIKEIYLDLAGSELQACGNHIETVKLG